MRPNTFPEANFANKKHQEAVFAVRNIPGWRIKSPVKQKLTLRSRGKLFSRKYKAIYRSPTIYICETEAPYTDYLTSVLKTQRAETDFKATRDTKTVS